MEIEIQRELREMSQLAKYLANDTLEAYLEYAAMYSKESWLVFHKEYLRCMELQILIA